MEQKQNNLTDIEIAIAAALQLITRDAFRDAKSMQSIFAIVDQAPAEDQLGHYQLLSQAFVDNAQAPLLAQYLVTFGGYTPQDVVRVVFGEMSPQEYSLQKNKSAITDQGLLQLIKATVQKNLGKPLRNLQQAPAQAPLATTQLPLTQALTQFQSVNDQVITNIPLELRGRTDLAPGTVKNWVYDYRDQLGGEKHTAMERGSYLFNSKNTKRLDTANRHNLALVLKSLDEETLLTIDTENSKILLDAKGTVASSQKKPQGQKKPRPQMPQQKYSPTKTGENSIVHHAAPQQRQSQQTSSQAQQHPPLGHQQPAAMMPPTKTPTKQAPQPRKEIEQKLAAHKQQPTPNTTTPQNTQQAFRDMHHTQAAPQTVVKPPQKKVPQQRPPSQQKQPQQEIAFSSKQKMPVEQMAQNVRGAMQRESTPQRTPTPPKEISPQYPAKKPSKKPRRSPYQMKPIE